LRAKTRRAKVKGWRDCSNLLIQYAFWGPYEWSGPPRPGIRGCLATALSALLDTRHTFPKPFGVSDFLKQPLNQTQTPTTKMIFYGVPIASNAHSNFLYTFYEQTKSLGDSIFAVRKELGFRTWIKSFKVFRTPVSSRICHLSSMTPASFATTSFQEKARSKDDAVFQRAWPEGSTLVIHCNGCQIFLTCSTDRVKRKPKIWTVVL